MKFAFPHSNGVNVSYVVFSSPLGDVRRVLGRAVQAGTRKLNETYKDIDGELQNDRITVKMIEGRTTLICDRST